MLVLPEEAVPQISVRQPRAKPPVSESSSGIPIGVISGAGRISSREAGRRAEVLEVASTWANISAVFFFLVGSFGARSFAILAVKSAEGVTGKIKGRPVAAEEKIGEADIFFLAIVREHSEQRTQPWSKLVYSPFLRLREYRLPDLPCQAIPYETWPGVQP